MRKFLLLFGFAALTLGTSCQKDKIEGLESEVSRLEDRVAGGQALIDGLRVDLSEITVSFNISQEELAAAIAANVKLEANNLDLAALNAALNGEIDALEGNVDDLQAQLNDVSAQLAAAQSENADLLARIAALEAALQAEKDRVAELLAQVEGLEGDLAEAKAIIANSTSNDDLRQTIIDGVLFLYAPSLDTDGDGKQNILVGGEDTGFDTDDIPFDLLFQSFLEFAAKMGS